MSEHWNASLHPPDSRGRSQVGAVAAGGGRVWARVGRDRPLRCGGASGVHGPAAFETDAAAEEPGAGHPDGGVGEPAPKHAASHAPANRRAR